MNNFTFTPAEQSLLDSILRPATERAMLVLAGILAARGLEGNWSLTSNGAQRIDVPKSE